MSPQAPNRWPWPPLITGGAVLVALITARLWSPPALFPGAFAAGGLLVGLALGLDLWAMLVMRRWRANILPHRAATALVTTGPFAWSRNPIYLANTVLLIGLGLIVGSVWFLLLAFCAAFLTRKLAIEREEKILAERFGKRYRDYARRVRRWI